MDARELVTCIDSGLREAQANELTPQSEPDARRELLSYWHWHDTGASRSRVHYELDLKRTAALSAVQEPRVTRKEPVEAPPWLLGLSSAFVDHSARIDRKLRGRVLEVITELSKMKMEVRGDTLKPLSGEFKGCWRYRIGDYRLIFLPDSGQGTLTLVAFLPRGEAYD